MKPKIEAPVLTGGKFAMNDLTPTQQALIEAYNASSVVAYRPTLARLCGGSRDAGILLSQFIYWAGNTPDADGWFYNLQKEYEEQTAIPPKAQTRARAIMAGLGIIEEHYARLDHQLKIRVNFLKLAELIEAQTTAFPERTNRRFGKGQIGSSGADKLAVRYKDKEITKETPKENMAFLPEILKTLGIEAQWEMGTVSPRDRETIKRLSEQFEQELRGKNYLATIRANWPHYWQGQKANGAPPTLSQLVKGHQQIAAIGKGGGTPEVQYFSGASQVADWERKAGL